MSSPTPDGPERPVERHPVITEDDLEALDTSDGHADDSAGPVDPVNKIAGTVGGWVAIVATLLIIILVTVSVVLRYVLNSSLEIAAEGPTYLFPWLIAGGAVVAQAHRGHIAVDVLVSRLRGAAHDRAQIAIWAFVTVLLGYLTYLSVYLIPPMAAQSTPIMGWPQLGTFGAFLLMAAVMTLQAAARTVYYLRHGAPDPGHGLDPVPSTVSKEAPGA